jgi:membrane-associated phospholipid phosphatase
LLEEPTAVVDKWVSPAWRDTWKSIVACRPYVSKSTFVETFSLSMLVLVDLTVALVAGLVAFAGASWCTASTAVPDRPSLEAAQAVGRSVGGRRDVRLLLATRLDREVASGLLLTLAVALTVGGGVVLGVLAYLVRRLPALQRLDKAVAEWAFDHRTPFSTHALEWITNLGTLQVVIPLAIAVAAFDLLRNRGRWCAPFLIVVLAGMELITTGVKDLVGRLRPAFVTAASHLGPSFPSGHSATAAAFYAAAALVLGRHLPGHARRLLAALAAGIAFAVGASRLLLDLHWLSDVIGGLALGWSWFALCAIIFGGRLLRATAAVDATVSAASAVTTPAQKQPAASQSSVIPSKPSSTLHHGKRP